MTRVTRETYPSNQAAYKKKSVLKMKGSMAKKAVNKTGKRIKFYSDLINEPEIALKQISCPQCSKILTVNSKSSESACLWAIKELAKVKKSHTI
jgi:hypothetical protein